MLRDLQGIIRRLNVFVPSSLMATDPSSLGGKLEIQPPSDQKISIPILLSLVRLADAWAILAAGLLTMVLFSSRHPEVTLGEQIVSALVGVASTSAALHLHGAYHPKQLFHAYSRIVISINAVIASVLVVTLCIGSLPNGRVFIPGWPLLWVSLSLALMVSGHAILSLQVRRWARRGALAQRIVIVGINELSANVVSRTNADEFGTEIVGVYRDDDDVVVKEHAGRRVLGRIEDIVAKSQHERIDAIILAIPFTQPERIARARTALCNVVADVYLATELAGMQVRPGDLHYFGATLVVNVRPRPLNSWQALQKSVFDKIAASLLLVVMAPALLCVALLIKLDSPGPILFRQPRLGFNNKVFTVFKFRTMHHHAADAMASRQTSRGDSRVTRVGRVLRKYSVDELPQLLNVLQGTMSLVGPRPHALGTRAGDRLLHDVVTEYALRHRVKPGITGWAQVNGWRGELRMPEQLEQRVMHDLYYIDNWSFQLDLKILLLTLVREINSRVAF
jgi:Undecaprenyl-phosphate glucose phosphotransferase